MGLNLAVLSREFRRRESAVGAGQKETMREFKGDKYFP